MNMSIEEKIKGLLAIIDTQEKRLDNLMQIVKLQKNINELDKKKVDCLADLSKVQSLQIDSLSERISVLEKALGIKNGGEEE